MRTPGHDEELAAGFLVSEGVVQRPRDILEVSQCPSTGNTKGNIVDVLLGGTVVNWDSLTRHVFSASSCGLCGKTSIESVFQQFPAVKGDWQVSPKLIASLPDKLRAAQETFSKTGGLHASGSVRPRRQSRRAARGRGPSQRARQDSRLRLMQRDLLPLDRHILLVSGRVSFEIIQKALAGGIALVAAISAPSSLAVDFAQEANQTLVGFLRGETMNVYTHPRRVLI
jgi:FdhD protein